MIEYHQVAFHQAITLSYRKTIINYSNFSKASTDCFFGISQYNLEFLSSIYWWVDLWKVYSSLQSPFLLAKGHIFHEVIYNDHFHILPPFFQRLKYYKYQSSNLRTYNPASNEESWILVNINRFNSFDFKWKRESKSK